MLAGVAVAVGRWPPLPGPPGPGKGPRKPWRNPPIPLRVPLTKAVMAVVRLAFIFVAWAAVILPDETAASIRVVASVTRSLMIVCGSTFFDLASAAMLWPPCSAVFRSAALMLRSFATTCSEAPPRRPKPGAKGPLPGTEAALELGVGVWAPDRVGTPNNTPIVAPAPRAAMTATPASSLRWLMRTPSQTWCRQARGSIWTVAWATLCPAVMWRSARAPAVQIPVPDNRAQPDRL